MRRKPAKSDPRPSEAIKIVLEGIPAPDAAERLRRAYALILSVAARAEDQAESKQPDSREVKHDG